MERAVRRREETLAEQCGTSDLVIKAGILLDMREGAGPIYGANIYVRDGRIIHIEESPHESKTVPRRIQLVDATNAIVMPGLVNAHTHAAMTLFRGLADDMPLRDWLYGKIFPAEASFLSHETVYWGSLLACLEMIASGTTCFIDGYFYEDGTARAVEESGLRALVAQGVIDFPAPGVNDPKRNLDVAEDFMQNWIDFSDRIIPGIFCHSPVTCSEKTLQKAWEISRRFDVPLQLHLSETLEERKEVLRMTGKKPVEYLEQLGLIDESLIAVHAVHLDEKEIEILARGRVKVVHAPESNMKLACGVAKAHEMLKKGLPVGLGTDGCASNNNLDLFQEMDSAAKLSKVFTMDPVSLDARTVLKMATVQGAAIVDLEDEIGTIEVGKSADIIVIDLESPHLQPVYDPYSILAYSARGADVRDVMVKGKFLMRNREFKTLDAPEIMNRVRKIRQRIGNSKKQVQRHIL